MYDDGYCPNCAQLERQLDYMERELEAAEERHRREVEDETDRHRRVLLAEQFYYDTPYG